MAPPKGNATKAQQKAARRELQLKKAAAKEQKKQKKQGQIDSDELPIEVLLQQLEEEQRQRQLSKTQVTLCNQPSPRAHGSLTLLPSGDLLLFGGESYDGKKVRVYGDLFKWDLDKSEWRRLEAPEMPKARCAHQAVHHNFGHNSDLFHLALEARRMSHRAIPIQVLVAINPEFCFQAIWRGLLILFGGFHDTGRDTRYYNDLHIFSFSENKWRKIEFPPHAHVPEPRGGCVFVVVGDVAVLHGGFAKVRDTHKRVQGKTYTDTWLLDLKPLAKGALTQTPAWEKIKNSGTPPSPRTDKTMQMESRGMPRGEQAKSAGAATTFAYFDSKGRLVKMRIEDMTGGEAGAAESPVASVHPRNLELPAAEIAGIQSDTGSTASCSPKCGGASGATELKEPSEASTAKEAALGITACNSPSPEQRSSHREVQRVFAADVPLPRLHGMLLVRGATLVLMGGIMELGSKEVTLDDCWTLNLNKRDRWVRVLEGTMHEQEWKGAESEAESSSGGSGGEASSDSGSDASDSEEEDGETSSADDVMPQTSLPKPPALQGSGPKNSKEMKRLAFEAASARVSLISDALRHMEELLQRQHGELSDDSSPKERGKAKGSSRQRK
ncbi:hypothetical protein ACSSS7_003024 [Eimeria intestinalis]